MTPVRPSAQRSDPVPADEGRHFDVRLGLTALIAARPGAVQVDAVATLRQQVPELDATFDDGSGATRTLWNRVGYLTGSDGREPRVIAQEYIARHVGLLGLIAADLVDYEETDAVFSKVTGATHLYYRQRLGSIPVYNGQLHINVNREGQIMSVNNAFVPGLAAVANAPSPSVSAALAVRRVADHLKRTNVAVQTVSSAAAGPRQQTILEARTLSDRPIVADLMWLPVGKAARLVWNFQVWTTDSQHAYDFSVDAASGQVWTRFD